MTCHFCGRARPVDPIPAGSLTVDEVAVEACTSCWAAHDDEDELRTLEGMHSEALEPEQLAALDFLRAAERLPPKRAAEPRCITNGCPNPARRAGLCWTCVRHAQRARPGGRRAA